MAPQSPFVLFLGDIVPVHWTLLEDMLELSSLSLVSEFVARPFDLSAELLTDGLSLESLLRQLEHLIEDINSIQTGAFRPVLDQPIVKAMLILAGGIGLSVSEYRAFLY